MFRSPRMSRFVSSLAMVGGLCITATQASAITLPDPESTLNGQAVTIQYGDFYSYSLPILNALTGTTDYTVKSSPGQLGQALVIASHPLANGQNNHNTGQGYTGVDNVFKTPNNGQSSTFNTTDAPDPGGAGQFIGDTANTWDIRLTTLSTYLGSEDLVFFFNHNQTNVNQDLQVRAQVTLSNDDGTQTQVFKFGDGATFDDYVTALGQFNSNIGTINHNLGANDVAYAVFSRELNQIIKTAGFEGYTVMQVSLDMIDLNSGYEQLFISPTTVNVPAVVTPVPEPMTATMGLLGMAGVALSLRRRR
jgi:hypothetical protein